MTSWPKLYKLDSKGKVRQWEILVDEIDGVPHYIQTHGIKGGKLQTTSTSVKVGKNVGKSNETTAQQQCILEAESLWNKQRDRKGYSETIPSEPPKLPMLAKAFNKDGKKIKWPAMTQPKLDGIRCMAQIKNGEITLKSRTNTEFKVLDHIKKALKDTVDNIPGKTITLDGELYNHDYKDDFQSLVSAIKRDDPKFDTELVQYHVYDLFAEWNFEDRHDFLATHLSENNVIKLVPTYNVSDLENFSHVYGQFIEDVYEGGMLRNISGPYEPNRRSPNLQKYKEFMDEEFTIVGAYENKGKQEGQCTFICVTKDGAEFGVKPKGSEEQRKKYWEDFQKGLLKGKPMTVRFFNWTTSDKPVPRFPVGIAIRDYE